MAGFTAGVAFCSVYETAGGGLPPGAPNVFDEICNAVADDLAPFLEDLFFLEEVTVIAEARFPAGDFATASSIFEPEAGSFGPSITLEGPGLPELVDFEAIPSNPVASQSYTAFANIVCEREETVVTLSVEGTDGYTNSVTCGGSCSLGVPGAAQGVVDTITIRINDPTIGEIFQVIGLFFR